MDSARVDTRGAETIARARKSVREPSTRAHSIKSNRNRRRALSFLGEPQPRVGLSDTAPNPTRVKSRKFPRRRQSSKFPGLLSRPPAGGPSPRAPPPPAVPDFRKLVRSYFVTREPMSNGGIVPERVWFETWGFALILAREKIFN